jgi:hypothetical protein
MKLEDLATIEALIAGYRNGQPCDECHRTYETSRIGLQSLPGLESTPAMAPVDAS